MRRQPEQLELLTAARRGGPRVGAGRPTVPGRRPPVPHRIRAEHKPRFPVHL